MSDTVIVFGPIVPIGLRPPISGLLLAAMIRAGLCPDEIHVRGYRFVEDLFSQREQIDRFMMTNELLKTGTQARIETMVKKLLHGNELTDVKAVLLPDIPKFATPRRITEPPWGWFTDLLSDRVAVYQACSTPNGKIQWLRAMTTVHYGEILPAK